MTRLVLSSLLVLGAVACGGSRKPPQGSAGPSGPDSCRHALSWVRELVSDTDASIRHVAAMRDGGAVIAFQVHRRSTLRESGKDLTKLAAVGLADTMLVRIDRDGAIAWTRRIGAAASRVEPAALIARPDGSVAVGGTYTGAPVLESDAGKPALPLAPIKPGQSYDPKGVFIAVVGAGGTAERVLTSNDHNLYHSLSSLSAAGDDIVAAGHFNGKISFGQGKETLELSSRGDEDAYVVRFSPRGRPVWGARLGGEGTESVRAIAVAKDGSVFVAGRFATSYRHRPETPVSADMTFGDAPGALSLVGGREDSFFAKLDPNGRAVFSMAIGGKEPFELGAGETVGGVVATDDGSAVLFGSSKTPVTFGKDGPVLAPEGLDYTAYLARITSAGRVEWTLPLGAIAPRSLAQIPGGDLAVSAHAEDDIRYPSTGAKVFSLTSAGLSDILLARHAPDGAPRWVARFGGDGSDWGEGVAADPEGALLLAGRIHGDFVLAEPGCAPRSVRHVARHHPNSFVVRVAPGADPSDPEREERTARTKREVKALEKKVEESTRAGDDRAACGHLQAITGLVPDDAPAWSNAAACLARLGEKERALAAAQKTLALASRYSSVILSEHEEARKKAYLTLATLDQAVALPDAGCGELAPARGCGDSLFACIGPDGSSGTAARIGVSAKDASLDEITDLSPVMPSLQRFGYAGDEGSLNHHWFNRAAAMDVLISDDETSCKVVTADACLGLIGMVCSSDDEGEARTTVDELYLWPAADRTEK